MVGLSEISMDMKFALAAKRIWLDVVCPVGFDMCSYYLETAWLA